MSQEQFKAFLEKVKADSSLQEKLKAAADANADVNTFAEIAKEAGFSITADDLKKAQSALLDEELEGAAGGARGSYCGTNILLTYAMSYATLLYSCGCSD